MTKISIKKHNNVINTIIIDGHTGYDDYGKDIVCASISSIIITTVNAIMRINAEAINYQEKDGFVELTLVQHTETIDLLISNMIDLLYQLQKQYKKNIKINEEVQSND